MAYGKIEELHASYAKKIEQLRRINEALSEKAIALEELHYALLYLRDVKEQHPTVGTFVQRSDNEQKVAMEVSQEIKNEEEPFNVKINNSLKADKNDIIPYIDLKELSHPIKEELMKLLDLGSKTSASLSEVLIYLYSHSGTDKETLAKQLAMGRSSVYRFLSLLKTKDLIETTGNRGETQFAISQKGISLIKKVLKGHKIYSLTK